MFKLFGSEEKEKMKQLETENREMQRKLADMQRMLLNLKLKKDEVKGNTSSNEAIKGLYEEQLSKVLEQKSELQTKIQKVDQMMAEMEEMEKKKKDHLQQPFGQHPPANNWIPPNIPFQANQPPQPGGYMGFPVPQPNIAPVYFEGPSRSMPPQHYNHPQPQNFFQPQQQQRYQGPRGRPGPRYHAQQIPQTYNRDSEQSNNTGQTPYNRQNNSAHHLESGRRVSENNNLKNRSLSQPRNQRDNWERRNTGQPPQNRKSNSVNNSESGRKMWENDRSFKSDNQPRQNYSGHYSENGRRDFENNDHKNSSNGQPRKQTNQRYQNYEQSRRTIFKKTNRGKGRGFSNEGNASSEEETSQPSQPGLKNQSQPGIKKSMPDLLNVDNKPGNINVETENASCKKSKKKKNIPNKSGEKNETIKKEKASAVLTTVNNKEEVKKPPVEEMTAPLSKTNLGPDNLLIKFIGDSIPTLVDTIQWNINLQTGVTGVVVMSDPKDPQPILESPKTLWEIINFKMKYPSAKSILL